MRFPWIKCHNDALMLEIDFYVFYPGNFLQRRAELAHALITVFALRCNLDRFQDRVVGGLWKKRIGWIGIIWSRRIHRFLCLTCENRAAVVCLLLCHVERSETSLILSCDARTETI